MKSSFSFISILVLISTLFSCDTEDARTPLGITISAPDFEETIEENPENGTILGTLEAFASDDSTIQYGNIIEADSEDSKFESETPIGALDIDNVTGELFIKDASLFNYDLNTEINATVNAISGQVTEAININIILTEILDIDSDINALIDLYEANITKDENDEDVLPILTNWDITLTDITETEIANWEGVTITDNRVTGLNISGKNLIVIPESLSKLNALTSLDISSNNIESLPTAVCEAFNNFENDSFIKSDSLICEETIDNQ